MHAITRKIRFLLWVATLVCACSPAFAARFECTIGSLRSNKWICKEDPQLCAFIFSGSQRDKALTRKGRDNAPDIAIVVDKWNDKFVIAHEDRPRIDNLFVEQYFYRIELETGKFLIANDYVTNSGRYLSKDDLDATDKKRFSYNRPRFFSDSGQCKFNARH
jgi:hypothetical protein